MKNLTAALFFVLSAQACGSGHESTSMPSNLLNGGGWKVEDSPYNLPPGSTIGVCDPESTGVAPLIVDSARLWLDEGGRDERIAVRESCRGTRVIKLVKIREDVSFYGRAHPLSGNVYTVDVPKQWAGHWTANHEIGHVFGFAHIFEKTVSIMNSEGNGRYMNGGYLSSYDRAEIKRMLSLSTFKGVNALWAKAGTSQSCLGADGVTYFAHAVVTRYENETFTCNNGKWIRG